MPKLSRREVISGLGGATLGAALGAGGVAVVGTSGTGAAVGPQTGSPVPVTGLHQAGITRPGTPQANSLVTVLDLHAPGPHALEGLASRIRELANPSSDLSSSTLLDGPGDLTVTVGLGARMGDEIAAALEGGLPAFAGDEGLEPPLRGGDIILSVCASDAGVLEPATSALIEALPGSRVLWTQRGFRALGTGTVARNPLGFLDGIIVPRTDAELESNVWIDTGPLAGGTVCVVRRLRLDLSGFRGQSIVDQEQIIGRHRSDGSPLSGGAQLDQVDLRAKTPEGEYLVPARSHARAAHPSFTDSELMLRRGYSFDNGVVDGVEDVGLLFVAFQRSIRTFVATQQRLDDLDDLMRFVTTTASGAFVILPGTSLYG